MTYVVKTTPEGYILRQQQSPPSDLMMGYHTNDLDELREHLVEDCGVDFDRYEAAVAEARKTGEWVALP